MRTGCRTLAFLVETNSARQIHTYTLLHQYFKFLFTSAIQTLHVIQHNFDSHWFSMHFDSMRIRFHNRFNRFVDTQLQTIGFCFNSKILMFRTRRPNTYTTDKKNTTHIVTKLLLLIDTFCY